MLTALQARVAKILAANRTEQSYFAGGAVLNQHASRVSDDLDVFADTDETIPSIVRQDVNSLREAGLEVSIDLEIYGCVDVTVRDAGLETQVQWMSESRMRFFPLQADPDWGLRLHHSDLAVNKVLAASTRRKVRDMLDLALIRSSYCPLGPLFLAAAIKLGSLSPQALLDQARQRVVSAPNVEIEAVRGLPADWTAAKVKSLVLDALDEAETFLQNVPDVMLSGLPVDERGVPVDRLEQMADIRLLADGGGRFPDFPEATPDFI